MRSDRLESTGHRAAGFGRSAGVRNIGGMLCFHGRGYVCNGEKQVCCYFYYFNPENDADVLHTPNKS